MKLPKYKVEEIKKLKKHAKIVHKLYFELKEYLIDDLGLDEEFVVDNLNSLANDDMEEDYFIEDIIEVLEDM